MKIKLASGLTLTGAKHGHLGIVPFKCWDVRGTDKLLKRIQARVNEGKQYYICGPVKGLSEVKHHSQQTKRRIAGKTTGRLYGKHEKDFNIPQSVQAMRATQQHLNTHKDVSARDKERKEVIKATRVRMG